MQTLIIYSTIDGQTLEICRKIKAFAERAGEKVSLFSLEQAEAINLADVDKVLIGASIRYGKHRPELYQFVNRNHAVLSAKVNGFFTVNVVARKPLKNTPETNPYMQKFLKLSLWQPQHLAVFAGKIDYPKYGLFDRTMICFIMWMTKGPTDLKGTFEFTDWAKVEAFGTHFSKL
ncbi:menaquinone-dependent protoporphyrinogen IX dehydrogenase [Shewanella oneidensis MR-1]|uniref:Protoporphyrinogen IX dehydrogenase [quinone] n=1 Tax=Shewanella oneidensis (strain ATCC 700550 / JCM 31522 / CIP 106686 / LMG 19005 / NCIMB 14063 / MR-1) TaxID=211586 RepID=Q8EKR5_SHEON|nr:menaquinone-dependent protoporphyrinogen IX dehydrogenase [Shewanella oneidensis]AAN53112.1 oxygen-independent protoporphyrinogen oxidase HemG [Shewanella oneidensis MR-1]MDX5997985.1 menaquinone-dependent protoporphyrinogen IX dehydrogenase [Shewanella oneidensis]MEE2027689.1 Protoporphyrinogen IX dehydrogenase [menaquinone] [Shewanella oneidensis]QKG95014.1 menaquinone-dependent protoporphyrinogen IX dehydrogenase [Shewanella oneidensis MR-1]